MEIYIVMPGDSIESIANRHGISIARLILDNGLENPDDLVVGQSLIILHPSQTYIVKDGDSLSSIAAANQTTLLQLIRDNPFLNSRDYIYPSETLFLRFDVDHDIYTNGYAYSFINRNILKKTLPYLSFLSVFNYRSTESGSIISYGDDSDIIELANLYHTTPLLMISALSPLGELNPELVYEILLNDDKSDILVQNIMNIVISKGFKGVNVLISYINITNQNLYLRFLTKLSRILKENNYTFVATVNPNIEIESDIIHFEKLDYNSVNQLVDHIVFIHYVWGLNKHPPEPVSSIYSIRAFLDYVKQYMSNSNTSLGKPLIGYDWILPYIPGKSVANAMTLASTLTLAHENNVVIEFDDASQTPYFRYSTLNAGVTTNHIVWFIDARSINSLDDLIIEYDLAGSGIWNINSFDQQLWSIINARFNIQRLIPEI